MEFESSEGHRQGGCQILLDFREFAFRSTEFAKTEQRSRTQPHPSPAVKHAHKALNACRDQSDARGQGVKHRALQKKESWETMEGEH